VEFTIGKPEGTLCLSLTFEDQGGTYTEKLKSQAADRRTESLVRSRCIPRHGRTINPMCRTKSWKSFPCKHQWVSLEKPCAEGKNFSNCKSFENRHARNPRAIYRAPAGSCPKCDKKDDYDGNKIRMVKAIKRGTKLGTGPSREIFGVECICTLM